MLSKKLFSAVVLSSLVLAGCSTTHYIDITPEVDISSANLQNNRVIQVTTDTKLSNNVGSITTGLKEYAEIYTTNDIKQSVKESILKGLQTLGFTPDQGVMPPARLKVDITKMSYTTRIKALKTIATLDFELQATLTAQSQTYQANYTSQKVKEYGTMPYQEDVQKDMNELASQTVNRLLADSNVLKLLK